MSFSLRKFKLFGWTLAIPIVFFIAKKIEHEQAAAFHRHRADLATCKDCHALFNLRAGTRLMMHFQDAHGMDLDTSIAVVASLYKQLLALKKVAAK